MEASEGEATEAEEGGAEAASEEAVAVTGEEGGEEVASEEAAVVGETVEGGVGAVVAAEVEEG